MQSEFGSHRRDLCFSRFTKRVLKPGFCKSYSKGSMKFPLGLCTGGGFGFRAWGFMLGFRIEGLGFRNDCWGLGFTIGFARTILEAVVIH